MRQSVLNCTQLPGTEVITGYGRKLEIIRKHLPN